ncbi:Glutamate-ammonia-ligase adenylyltransferase [compost metagenome]
MDIEFVVQLGVLATAATHPAVIESTATAWQLHELDRSGWLSHADAATLGETARALHRQRMLHVLAPGEPQAAIDTHPSAALFEKFVGSTGAVAGTTPSG